ncbi:MAG: Holliday junction resolvase RuvX [Candidatus Omnitrophica bacterium]|nr:Holliday junction resolvase RuvX [Candidatus Omnitrophota bacterium]
MGRVIGIDFGERRIGIAVSDETETISSVVSGIEVGSIKDCIDNVKAAAEEYKAKEIVVGLPINMDGSKGPSAEKAINFCEKLKQELSIPVLTYDERLTTKQGESILLSADMSRAKRKKKIDKLAAQIMLQGYLDSKKKGD